MRGFFYSRERPVVNENSNAHLLPAVRSQKNGGVQPNSFLMSGVRGDPAPNLTGSGLFPKSTKYPLWVES